MHQPAWSGGRAPTAANYPLLAVEEAVQRILNAAPAPQVEEVALTEAAGRVLAADIYATEHLPPYPASAVDGYAVIAADPTEIKTVVDEITAGRMADFRLQPGQTARVMTGAPVPDGADAVIMVEQSQRQDDGVSFVKRAEPGDGIHPAGQDLRAGQLVLETGTIIGPAEVGLIATVGRASVPVYRRPVVAVLSTGDELIEPGEERTGAQVRDSNRYAIMASIQAAGALPKSLGFVRDDEAEQRRLIEHGLQVADVVITSGGVSMGSRDLIKSIFEALGTVHVGRIAFKPGKPLTCASTPEGKLLIGLPGFPVSSLVSFEVFIRPALLKMQGYRQVRRPRVTVALDQPARPTPDRTEYQRAVVYYAADGSLRARTTGSQVSSRLLSMVGANALLEILPADQPLPAGSKVPALLTGPLLDHAPTSDR